MDKTTALQKRAISHIMKLLEGVSVFDVVVECSNQVMDDEDLRTKINKAGKHVMVPMNEKLAEAKQWLGDLLKD